ncbi:matrixin family metalloprotease [Acidisoma silvae]|uniref:Matrixin family metalloprotease n=1 Tax=Acidisoma silvae TaxID=2802396 RepID=A0A963YT46_9PROT|nr:matrixin family metalloprotease [Acidisoma silvae]MCB8875873.1 matrixin family metalloprotease [Acidisoma silvae]
MSSYSYALIGNTWPAGTTTLTYSFATSAVNGNAFSSSITNSTERTEIAAAFATWSTITGIQFVEVADGTTANIRLNFADVESTSAALGQTTLSYAANGITNANSPVILLEDPNETPLVADSTGILYYSQGANSESEDTTFLQLVEHEIGHVLGFADNNDPNSIENASLTSINRGFDGTDLIGALTLYPSFSTGTLPTVTTAVTTAAASATPDVVATSTAASSTSGSTTTAPTLFTLSDNGSTTAVTADSYTGPLGFLPHGDFFSYNGSDNVNIVASSNATNPLIASGSGIDLLQGTATGTSVLDAGTGANIDIDGGNGATTFVQNGYVSGATWDFLQNFHGADEDILFGYIPGLSKLTFTDSAGMGSDYGVTATLLPGNGNSEEVTFVGVTMADLHGAATTVDGVPSWVLWTS